MAKITIWFADEGAAQYYTTEAEALWSLLIIDAEALWSLLIIDVEHLGRYAAYAMLNLSPLGGWL